MKQFTAEELTARIQQIDPLVTVLHIPGMGWHWQKRCQKWGGLGNQTDHVGQSLGATYEGAIAQLKRIYGEGIAQEEPAAEPEPPFVSDRRAMAWRQAIDDASDLIAWATYHRAIVHPQTADMLDLLRQLKEVLAIYTSRCK